MEDYTIRNAGIGDLGAVNRLLEQVLKVHHDGRPDLFNAVGKKYTDAELLAIFSDPDTPVFVYERQGRVEGYAFCAYSRVGSGSLKEHATIYVDDICVDENARGGHIGTHLFDYVKEYARSRGCYNITLRVWECNPGAKAFYKAMGMSQQSVTMELLCKD